MAFGAPGSPGPEGSQADLRVVGASLALDGAAASVDGETVADAVAFGTPTRAVRLPPGRHEVAVGSVTATVEVAPGCTTNVVAAERPLGAEPTLVPVPGCGAGRIPAGAARLTVLVASDEPGTVRAAAGDGPPVDAAPFRVSAPLHPAAGRVTVTLASAATGAPYATVPADLAEGTATLAVFAGGGDEPFRVLAVFDGAQPARPPLRIEIHTGARDGAAPVEAGAAPFVAAAAIGLGALAAARRRLPAAASLLLLAMALTGCSVTDYTPGTGPEGNARVGPESAPGGGAPTPPATGGPTGDAMLTAAPGPAADPVRVRIPDLAIDASVVPLDAEQADDLPDVLGSDDIGWFRGTAPGTVGVATLAGHTGRAAVLRHLVELPTGAEIVVVDADGRERSFTVRSTGVYAKGGIPDATWAPVRTPTLVLISCTGPRRPDGLHRDNVVVRAEGAT